MRENGVGAAPAQPIAPGPAAVLTPGAGAARPDSHEGMLLFIQYGFMPNHLEYCGTDDHTALVDYWHAGQTDMGLRQLLHTFTGALPYLKLIARTNGIADPFDCRVVEAYWVGNALLDNVDVRGFYEHLTERFSKQLQGKAREYVVDKLPLGARPHHDFHVFDVYSRVGPSGQNLHVMENCRISWGQIQAVEPAHFLVEAQPLVLQGGKLALGSAVSRQVLRQIDGKGFTQDAGVGDWVSIHWNWACDVVSPTQVRRLENYTRQHIQLANLTI
jgi:hypothetical protein